MGLASPPQEPHPALGLQPRFSALRASFSSLFQQSSFPPMHRGLDKTLVVPIFVAKECTRMQDIVLKIYKNSGGRDPRTSAAEGETFVRTHPRAHLPDAGAPSLILGWLRPWSAVIDRGEPPKLGSAGAPPFGLGPWLTPKNKPLPYVLHITFGISATKGARINRRVSDGALPLAVGTRMTPIEIRPSPRVVLSIWSF